MNPTPATRNKVPGRAGTAPAVPVDELSRQLTETHATGAWGRVIDCWRLLVKAGAHAPALSARAADAFFRHGLDLVRRGNLEAAVQHLQAATDLEPESVRYRYHLALAHHRSQNWHAAMSGYAAVLRQDKAHTRAAYHLCLTCLQSGKECQAGGLFDQAFGVLLAQANRPGPVTPRWVLWGLQRLQAWRDFVLTGSTRVLETVFAAAPAAGPSEGPRPGLALEAALVTLAAGKVETARRRLETSEIEAHPTLARLTDALRATLAARAGHKNKADHLALGISLDDDQSARAPASVSDQKLIRAARVRALWEVGLTLWWQGDRARAIPHWHRARALEPQNAALRHNVALALDESEVALAGEDWGQLAKAWERGWQKKGDWERPEYALAAGLAYQRAGEEALVRGFLKEARRYLQRAAALAPEDSHVLLDLALLASEDGDAGWVGSNLARLSECFRDDAEHLAAVGHVCLSVKLAAEAEPLWRRILELDPEHQCAADHLADFYAVAGERAWTAGRTGEALAHFEQGLALVPDASRLHAWTGGIYLVQGDRKRAAAAFRQAAAGDDEPEALAYADVEVGKRLLQAGLPQDAKAAFDRALRADSSPDTYLGIGLAYLKAGRVDLALEPFKTAGRRSGQDLDVVTTALEALLHQKEAREAECAVARELALAALEVHPDEHVFWMFRALAEFGLGGPKMDAAVARRARTLALREGDRGAVRLLDEMLSAVGARSGL